MNPFALAFLVTVAVVLGGSCLGFLSIIADAPSRPRLAALVACAYVAGFATCAIALVVRTQ